MIQESAFCRMCKVLASAFGLALASFFYSLWICGTCTAGYFMGLIMAFLLFTMSMFDGVVIYLE
jgi:hypothetical protein